MFKRFFNWLKSLFKRSAKEEVSEPKDYNLETEQHTIVQDNIDIVEWEVGDSLQEQPFAQPEPVIEAQGVQVYGEIDRVGKYFTISELCASATAKKKGINNVPNGEETTHLYELIVKLLDLIRESWTEKCKQNGWGSGGINVTSGFRCSKLNKAVGGVSNSAHLYGYAADTQPSNKRQSDYEKFIRDWVKQNPNVAFDQIIVERSKTSRWVHIAIKDGRERQRRQCFDLKA